jgi:DNA-binding MarR family transcriptional regulator
MQSIQAKCKRLVRAMAPAGNLFFLLTIQEMRRQGLTFIAFFILQRIIREPGLPEFVMQNETGFSDYEISRACSFLVRSRLAEKKKSDSDARVRLLVPTERGIRVRDQVLSIASTRLKEGLPIPGRLRRVSKATASFLKANRMLLDPLQLSFFDTDLFKKDRRKAATGKRKPAHSPRGRSGRSKP